VAAAAGRCEAWPVRRIGSIAAAKPPVTPSNCFISFAESAAISR